MQFDKVSPSERATLRPRIVIVITHGAYVRSYLRPDLLQQLESDFDVEILVRRSLLSSAKKEAGETLKFHTFDGSVPDSFKFLARVITRHYWARSSSFKIRILRKEKWESRGDFLDALSGGGDSLRRIRNLGTDFWPFFFSLRGVFPLFRLIADALVPRAAELSRALSQIRPDIVLVPSNAYGYFDHESIRASNKLRAKSVLAVDNWDNISSKSVLIQKPTLTTVLGPQSAKHALEIHGLSDQHVLAIGAPRFDVYQNRRARRPVGGRQRYFFLAGYSQPFDEFGFVSEVSRVLREASEDGLPEYRIIYRPHPWSRLNDFSAVGSLDNVELDHPDFENQKAVYESLAETLAGAKAVLGAPTTLLLEALILGKQTGVVAWDDPSVLVGPKIELENYVHFKELRDTQGITMLESRDSLRSFLMKMIRNEDEKEPYRKFNVEYFVTLGPGTYATRLLSALQSADSSSSGS